MKNFLFLTISLCFSTEIFASEFFESKSDTTNNDNIQLHNDPIEEYMALNRKFKPVLDALEYNRTYHLIEGFKTLAADIQEVKADFESNGAANKWQIAFVADLDALISKRVKKYAKNKAKRANIKRRKVLQSGFKH